MTLQDTLIEKSETQNLIGCVKLGGRHVIHVNVLAGKK